MLREPRGVCRLAHGRVVATSSNSSLGELLVDQMIGRNAGRVVGEGHGVEAARVLLMKGLLHHLVIAFRIGKPRH